jgi:RimJ/RimL family protein N-acetyltransferase
LKTETHITIRLREYHRPALEAHFLALESEDRRLRFGAPIADEALAAYVARIDFDRDGAFAVQDDELRLLAVVHVANSGQAAEMGLSVLPGWRGQGLGQALFQRAVTHLRNRGTLEAQVHCLTENAAMMHLARKSGMRIDYSGGESDARLVLRPATASTLMNEWLADRQAETMQAFRHQARMTRSLLGFGNA